MITILVACNVLMTDTFLELLSWELSSLRLPQNSKRHEASPDSPTLSLCAL